MNKRHEAAIRDMLDSVRWKGFAEVPSDLLVKGWFGQMRQSKTMWQQLSEMLPEDLDPSHVAVFERYGTVLILNKEETPGTTNGLRTLSQCY